MAPAFEQCPSGELIIRGNGNPDVYGAWRGRFESIQPNRHYRLVAHYRTQDVKDPAFRATARVEWLGANGQRLRPPDYAVETGQEGDWHRVELISPSLEKGQAAVVELGLRWTASGSVTWRNVQLTEVAAPASRPVSIASLALRPRDTGSAAASIERFCEVIDKLPGKLDLICLPEGSSVVGTGKVYNDVAEPIPGPLSQRLGEVARKRSSYLIAGLYERVGKTVYNTAVLLDRKGEVVGKYRKAHLPKEEAEGGITPGDSYPVFETDFGKVGIMVCWDVQFPEPARALALAGAEIIVLPIWGGSDLLARARAIENHVFLVSSSYDMKTFVVDPTGEVLAEAAPANPVAQATIDLNRIILQLPWLGDMKTCTWKERRPDIR